MSANAARSLPFSLVRAQLRRALRACHRAQAPHRADIASAAVEPRPWSALTALERHTYRERAAAELITPGTRDVVIMRDQVTRADRARILQFGGRRRA